MGYGGGRRLALGVKRLVGTLPVLDSILTSGPAFRLRRRLYRIDGDEVARATAALDDAGVEWFLAGGWGIDALLGEMTRTHGDLDLCIEVDADGERRSVEALGRIGYQVTVARAPSGRRIPFRSVLRDRRGRTIDLVLVTAGSSSPTSEPVPTFTPDQLDHGTIRTGNGTQTVRCLSATEQVRLHSGYVPRPRERQDIDRLCTRFGLTPPPIYRRRPVRRSLRQRARRDLWALIGRVRGMSAVLLEIPEAAEVIGAVGGRLGDGMPPHVTILYPFVPPRRIGSVDHDMLGDIAARTEPLKLECSSVAGFGSSSHLTVTPSEPILALTDRVRAGWPDHAHYGGSFKELVPHVTVAHGAFPDEIDETVEPLLPISSEVENLTLMVRGLSGRWRRAGIYPLGAEGNGR